jgi:hypothetical protein
VADGDLGSLRRGLDDLVADLEPVVHRRRGTVCSECGVRFEWPGQLEEHMRVVHPQLWEESIAA